MPWERRAAAAGHTDDGTGASAGGFATACGFCPACVTPGRDEAGGTLPRVTTRDKLTIPISDWLW